MTFEYREDIDFINQPEAKLSFLKEELINFYNNNKERFAYPATYSIEAWVSKTMIDNQIAIKQLNNNGSIELIKIQRD